MSQGPEPGEVLWRPTAERAAASQLAAFLQAAGVREGRTFAGYDEAWAWSVAHPERFWAAAWDFFDVTSSTPYERVLALPDGARRCPGPLVPRRTAELRRARPAAVRRPC